MSDYSGILMADKSKALMQTLFDVTAERDQLRAQLADHLRAITTCPKCGLRWVEPDSVEPPCPRCDKTCNGYTRSNTEGDTWRSVTVAVERIGQFKGDL